MAAIRETVNRASVCRRPRYRADRQNSLAGLADLGGVWQIKRDRYDAIKTQLTSLSRGRSLSELSADYPAPSDDSIIDWSDVSYERVGGVAYIPVIGAITRYPTWFDEFCGFAPTLLTQQMIDTALQDYQVSTIALMIDSPGGLAQASGDLASYIAKKNGPRSDVDGTKPIIAIGVGDIIASAAYKIACRCKQIITSPETESGCIGTLSVLTDDSKFWQQMGISFTVIASGGVKGAGMDGTVPPELVAEYQRSVDDMNDLFVAHVAAGRKMTTQQAKAVADGRWWIASKSKELGLIDDIANVDDAIAAITTETQMQIADQVKAYIAEHPEDSAVKAVRDSGFAAGKTAGQSEARQIEIDRMKSIEAACPGRPALAIKQFVAGGTADTAKLIVSELDAEKQAVADASSKAATDLAAANAEIERLKADKGTQPPIQVKATAGGDPSGGAGTVADRWAAAVADAKKRYGFKDDATAMQKVVAENPKLHKEYLEEANKPK